jgi:hypothetical protein
MVLNAKMAMLVLIGLATVASDSAFAQITGAPVNSSGQSTLSGQPYVKTHKRHNKNFYGKHYDSLKHSKGGH